MKHKVIDNFLEEDYFDSLASLLENAPWFFKREINPNHNVTEDNLFYMVHPLYDDNVPMSSLFNNIIPLLDKLEARCLLRIKVNLYPNTEKLHEHPMHTDFPFPHSGAILSLNTCDGYTKLKDGTKIDSVANRILLFDPNEEHCSTTTTNVSARFNININYINVENKIQE